MKKRLISVCMVFALLLVWSPSVYAASDDFVFTEEPFLIFSEEDLMIFAQAILDHGNDAVAASQSAILMADLDMTGIEWKTIHANRFSKDYGYTGTFDGNGHKISNLYCSDGGFFGGIRADGCIRNLTLENVDFYQADWGRSYAGALASTCEGVVENCYVTGRFEAQNVHHAGGLVGSSDDGVIRNCVADLTISYSTTVDGAGSFGAFELGGVVGFSGGIVDGCVNYGSITVTGYNCGCGSYIGGVVGRAAYTDGIRNCGNYGDIYVNLNVPDAASSNVAYVAGICTGLQGMEVITNCFNAGSIHAELYGEELKAGGIDCSYTPPGYRYFEDADNCWTSGAVYAYSDVNGLASSDHFFENQQYNLYFCGEHATAGSKFGQLVAEAALMDGTLVSKLNRNVDALQNTSLRMWEQGERGPVFSDRYWLYSDVVLDSYYEEPVRWAVSKGITSGTGNGLFSPNAACTRAQVVTFLWRAMGCPEPVSDENPFSDVTEDDYFYKSVLWAVENGITAGTGNGQFSPNAPCTRGQVATFLWRAQGQPQAETDENPFSDVTSSDYFYNSVLWAVENGITAGTGNGLFSPNASCTRGQVVTLLYRTDALEDTPIDPEPTEPEPTEPKPTEPEPTQPEYTEGMVADPVDLAYLSQRPANGVQDIRYFSYGQVRLDGKPGGSYNKYKELPLEIIHAYIAMLQENGYTLVDAYEQSFSGTYRSWGLIRDDMPELETMSQQFSKTPCHICIWTSKGSAGTKTYRIDLVDGLELCDLGLRMDGKNFDLTPGGESLGAGLIRLDDGSYQTSDGRLTAQVGQALVVRDGVGLTGDVFWETQGDTHMFTVEGYTPEESIVFGLDGEALKQGAIFQKYDLEQDEFTFHLTVDEQTWGQTYNTTAFASISVRVMYYQPEGDAVLYIHTATTVGEPGEIEILCAVSTAPVPEKPMPEYDPDDLVRVDGGVNQTITITTDQVLEIFYDHRGWDSMYHVFEWTVTEGEELVEMYGAESHRFFFPTDPGVVIVKLRYGYTKEEPDVLTGIPRDNPKSHDRTYSIIIVDP